MNTDEKLATLADSYVDLIKQSIASGEDITHLLRILAMRAALVEVDSLKETLK